MKNQTSPQRVEDAPYSLPWLRKYRPAEVVIMESLQLPEPPLRVSPRTHKKYLNEIRKLEERLRFLKEQTVYPCHHPIEVQSYSESGRQDTLGGWRPGMDYRIRCERCGEYLKSWGD